MKRRDCLRVVAGLGATCALAAPALAQNPSKPRATMRIVQLLDTSTQQQELSRDYSTGVRLAFAEAGRSSSAASLSSVELDGTTASLRAALQSLRDDPRVVALLGNVGERLALDALAQSRELGLSIAHVAPWMADTRHDGDDDVLPLFASRETQVQYALRNLEVMGVRELGVVYASARERQVLEENVSGMAARLKLGARSFAARDAEDLQAVARRIPDSAPAILLFIGGSVELARFTQGLGERHMQRYVISLSDVDVTSLMQLSPGRSVPVILTQVVPNAQTSSTPMALGYRNLLRQLFDEAPSPVSLAGYVAGRYATQVLARLDGSATRAAVLGEFRKRPSLDLGGFRIAFNGERRGSNFVSQTLLTGDGRLLG
ncbi:MAG TPA: ABC transporter substrate-binding protein [Burkholderiaceae bacterium]|jgi:hypothetical protein|nr:ABC transporter substrate-binding protein [Burkholderiaceae bacterium]